MQTVRGPGVPYGFNGLRLDAVVDADYEHDDIGDGGAARAHRFERVVAGRVDESDAATIGALQTYYSVQCILLTHS